MNDTIKFTIDGKECTGKKGQNLVEAAKDNGVYIPTLCHVKDENPAASCRVCNVKINGNITTACTTTVSDGMEIENNTDEINDLRKAIVEVMFVEGNHFCPSCEKSGNCELQAIAYRYQMMVPQFPFNFPKREIDASAPKIYLERNRCILCKKCIRSIKDEKGQHIFAFRNRGSKLEINIDHELAAKMTDEQVEKAMDICPVGAIIMKEKGYNIPIGQRKYDKMPIGSDIEKN